MKLVAVQATGTRQAEGFACGAGRCCVGSFPVEQYPPSPEGERLRHLRVDGGVAMRPAAKGLGLSPTELSGLEHGKLVPEDHASWARLEANLRKLIQEQKGGYGR